MSAIHIEPLNERKPQARREFSCSIRVEYEYSIHVEYQHLYVMTGIRSYADMAQLAEQLICNQQVIGSSPIIGFGMST